MQPEKSAGKYFAVSYDSRLGQVLSDYFASSAKAEKAAIEFVLSLNGRYGFKAQLSAETEIFPPDDAEHGGIIAIYLPKGAEMPDPIIWATMTDPEDPSVTLCYPRVSVEYHYVRYNKAERLAAEKNPQWIFKMDGARIRTYPYESVWRSVLPVDRSAIAGKSGVAPHPRTKLALGTFYKWDADYARSQGILLPPYSSDAFREARDLYREMTGLPVVPVGTLARILDLRTQEKKPTAAELSRETFVDFCDDAENRRYLFHTGLKPLAPDMTEVQGVEDKFN